MKISYNVDEELLKPVRKTKETPLSEEMQAIVEFVNNSDQDNIAFEYDSETDAKKRRNHIIAQTKKRNLPVKTLLRGNKVVVIYAAELEEAEDSEE